MPDSLPIDQSQSFITVVFKANGGQIDWKDKRNNTLRSELTKLWKAGKSTQAIADELTRRCQREDGSGVVITKHIVISKAHNLGLKSRPSPLKRVRQRAWIAANIAIFNELHGYPEPRRASAVRRHPGGREGQIRIESSIR